jgi:hypothetical protein
MKTKNPRPSFSGANWDRQVSEARVRNQSPFFVKILAKWSIIRLRFELQGNAYIRRENPLTSQRGFGNVAGSD